MYKLVFESRNFADDTKHLLHRFRLEPEGVAVMLAVACSPIPSCSLNNISFLCLMKYKSN